MRHVPCQFFSEWVVAGDVQVSAVSKALGLLVQFTQARPEIGLTELCRLAKRDKTTTYRHLQNLEAAGFVEQNPLTRQYRLGPALVQLAQMRELTVPRKRGAEAPLRALAEETGETSHVSVLSGRTLYTLMSIESPRHSTRVVIDIPTMPFHATASGLCALAFGPPDLADVACRDLRGFTDRTPTSAEALGRAVAETRDTGFGRAIGSYETDVASLAVPVFDEAGLCAGAVAVASVATRFDAALERHVQEVLVQAGRRITRNWGGQVPDGIEAKWSAISGVQVPAVSSG